MNITDVRMRIINNDTKMKAIASITIDGGFAVHDIKVIDSDKGLFIAMPSKKDNDGMYRDVCHPINTAVRREIQDIVIQKYEQLIAEEQS